MKEKQTSIPAIFRETYSAILPAKYFQVHEPCFHRESVNVCEAAKGHMNVCRALKGQDQSDESDTSHEGRSHYGE